jgi:hypothetical protein
VSIDGGGKPLAEGDELILVEYTDLYSDIVLADNIEGYQGALMEYEFEIDTTSGTEVIARIKTAGLTQASKAVNEAFLGGLALVNQGGELVAGPGLDNAAAATARGGHTGYLGLSSFAAASYGQSRFMTGSHVDVDGFAGMVGVAIARQLDPMVVTLGAFLEFGTGEYETFNDFARAPSVYGNGDVDHIGGGILGRADFAQTAYGFAHAEFSARYGQVDNEYTSHYLSPGRAVNFKTSSHYYGFHVGVGYDWMVTAQSDLDAYLKYFYTQQEGDTTTLSTGDVVTFGDAESQRVRLGGRYSQVVTESIRPYLGLAYEREFDGEATATAYGRNIASPKLGRNTGIGELGLALEDLTGAIKVDLGAQAYFGDRKGLTGSLSIRYDF